MDLRKQGVGIGGGRKDERGGRREGEDGRRGAGGTNLFVPDIVINHEEEKEGEEEVGVGGGGGVTN